MTTESDKNSHSSTVYVLLLLIFIASGMAGLIYQSIWTQYLGLFLGHAAYAQSLVLILFMGGMGVGAWFVSKRSESIARPLLVYAAIEFALGVFGLAFDAVYRTTTEFAYAHIFAGSGQATVGVARWGLAALLILPQCILLGATFPLMSAGCLRYMPESGGKVLGGLYFSNSLGAAAGALLSTFVLLPVVGLPGALLTAGLLNIAVAVAAWLPGKIELPGRVADSSSRTSLAPVVVLFTAAVTGLTSFVYEVVWVRMLALVLGSTIHAFELMLAAFISGLAFGGLYLRSRADKFHDTLRSVAWVQIFMGLAALLSLWLYAQSFHWVGGFLSALDRNADGYLLFNLASALICLLIMFPAAFFAGMTLPLLTLTLLRRGGERVIGQVYSANTLGCIVGVLLAVHVLMPLIGVKYALWVAASLDLALGVWLFFHGRDAADRGRRHDFPVAAGVAVAALAVTALGVVFDPLQLASSVYRHGTSSLRADTQMLYYRDGKTASVSMFTVGGFANARAVATNGKVDASANIDPAGPPSPDEYTMILAGLLPLAYLPDASNVGVIGFGSGITTNTVLASSAVKRVDTIEIESSIIEASRFFERLSARAYNDPRSRIVIDDAKAYFATNAEKYDVIVSEPSNPWVSGVASLFTQEFYRFVPKHLNERGVLVQWLQLYEISPELVSTVLRAMLPHFEDVQVYMANRSDMLIVAKPKGKLPRPSDAMFADPAVKATAETFGLRDLADLRRHALIDRNGLVAAAAMYTASANSDFFPILQLNAPLARFSDAKATEFGELQAAPVPVLEAAGQYQPPSISVPSPSASAALPRIEAQWAALETRAGLLGEAIGIPQRADREMASTVALVRDFARRCENPQETLAWLAGAVKAAGVTIPQLAPADLKGVWIEPAWAQDCKNPSPLAADAAVFFASLAQRDWSSVDQRGEKLLAAIEGVANSGEIRRYLLTARLAAKFALGKDADIAKLAGTIDRQPDGASFHDRWLISFAALRAKR